MKKNLKLNKMRKIIQFISKVPLLGSIEKQRRQNCVNRMTYLLIKETTSKKDKVKITKKLLNLNYHDLKHTEWEALYIICREGEPVEMRKVAENRMKEIKNKEDSLFFL
jgi:hypothetical protein